MAAPRPRDAYLDSLAVLEAGAFAALKDELRRAERRSGGDRPPSPVEPPKLPAPVRAFLSEHPGTPLGKGMPTGSTLREDGESHRHAWMRIVRNDPCAYCGRPVSGTVDHIEPQSFPTRGLGGAHTWLNYTGACERCNGTKGSTSLVMFLAARAGCRGARLDRVEEKHAVRVRRERARARKAKRPPWVSRHDDDAKEYAP